MEKLKRVACYIRVSTEEQKKKGYSVDTQRDNLNEYIAKQTDMVLVDFYVDDGISADKLPKREGLQRLLHDIEAGKIDMVLFTKLDRWFRSVQKYYQIQKVLDDNNVVWRTIHEDYETITSGGKFKVNIMLSVAQQERDRCSERIKDVFDYRAKQGFAITNKVPIGLKIEDHRVVIDDDTVEIVKDLFNKFELCGSVHKSRLYIRDKYDIKIGYTSVKNMLSHPLYIGEYRENHNYCEPIITHAQFDRVQNFLKMNVRKRGNNRTYIFSALCVCGHCGRKLAGNTTTRSKTKRPYMYYRCNYAYVDNKCDNRTPFSEKKMETFLLENIDRLANEYIASVEEIVSKTAPKKRNNRKTIEKKMQRLNELYINGFIDMDKYKADYAALQSQIIPETEDAPQDVEGLKKFLNGNFREIYATLNEEERQALWRGVIKQIKVSNGSIEDIVFL